MGIGDVARGGPDLGADKKNKVGKPIGGEANNRAGKEFNPSGVRAAVRLRGFLRWIPFLIAKNRISRVES